MLVKVASFGRRAEPFMPTKAPREPSQRSQPNPDAASQATRTVHRPQGPVGDMFRLAQRTTPMTASTRPPPGCRPWPKIARAEGEVGFRARRDEPDRVGSVACQDVRPAGAPVAVARVAQRRQVLACQGDDVGVFLDSSASCQHSAFSMCRPAASPAGPEWREGRARCSTGLMGRAVLAETDRIVGHDVDHAQAHQRRETDRGPAIVGEHQEGAAIGMMPPCRPCRSWPRPSRARGCR